MNAADAIPETPRMKRPWYQFSLRTLLLASFCLAVLIAASVAIWREYADPLRHIRHFHRAVARADRIVVRGWKLEGDAPVDELDVLFEVTDRDALAEVRQRFQFLSQPPSSPCFCGGYPELDWYRGDERVLRTWLKHNEYLEWLEIKGMAALTPESSQRIVQWLADSGVPSLMMKSRRELQEAARQDIRSLMPADFWEAVVKAEAETAAQLRADDSSAMEPLESLKDRYVGQLCKDRPLLYRALFRMLGVRCASWDNMDVPELIEAFEFLTRAPRDELDRAFRSAADSPDPAERQGAARMVFTQHFMTMYEKTEDDLGRWMSLFVALAYGNPYPANRRLVLDRLMEHPQVQAGNVLAQAVEDPDARVRRRAIEALRLRGGTDAAALLRRVAAGQTNPRKAKRFDDMDSDDLAAEDGQDAETDAKAAAEAPQAMGR